MAISPEFLRSLVSSQFTDGFDRLRISSPYSLFDFNSVFGKQPSLFQELPNGSATHDSDSYISMPVTSGGTTQIRRQSYEYISYQSGRSKLMFFTGVLNVTPASAVVANIGCFDDANDKTTVAGGGNGLFFQLNGTNLFVVLRYSTDNSGQTDISVRQNNWNIDPLNGKGPSGVTLDDFSKNYIFVIEQKWLGVGSVRFGIVHNNVIHYCHEFSNFAENNIPYNRMAKLPVRYEIVTFGANNGEMRMQCGTIMSEGGYQPVGRQWAAGLGYTFRTAQNTGLKPMFAIRLKSAFNRTTVKLRSLIISVDGSVGRDIHWQLIRLPNASRLTGASWVAAERINGAAAAPSPPLTGLEYDISSTAISLSGAVDYVVMQGGYVQGRQVEIPFLNSDVDIASTPPLVSNIEGESFVYVVVAIVRGGGGSGNTPVGVEMGWVEITE